MRILDARRRADAVLRAAVLQAFMLDSLIPGSVDAEVQNGLVTLTGTARWQYQRDGAKFICAGVPGVLGIEDEITLTPASGHGDIQMAISAAFADKEAALGWMRTAVDRHSHRRDGGPLPGGEFPGPA